MAKIILLYFAWRIGLFLVASQAPTFLPVFANRFPYVDLLRASGLPYWIWSFGNFDGVHYLRIAEDGYAYQFTQVFFPLYPILIKAGSFATFGNLLISALIISNAAFLVGLLIFYKLVKSTYNDKIATWSTIFVLAFPTSFYFGAVYTEGIFFLMVVASFYLLEKNKTLLASIIGSFASATRLVGLFLAPALSLNRRNILPLLIVPLGFLTYVSYLTIEFNNPLYFLSAQSIFGQERETTQIVFLPQVIWRYTKILTTTQGLALANAAFEFLMTAFAFVSLAIAARMKIKRDWLLFSFLAILTPTLTGTFTSMPRYVLVAFPIYIALAHIKSLHAKIALIIVFLSLLFASTIFFTQGYWVA